MILAFDITSEQSFASVRGWINSIYKVKGKDIPVVLVGNKIDLEESRVITHDNAQDIAGEFALNYHETSALEGLGFTEMINDVMGQTYLQKVRPKL